MPFLRTVLTRHTNSNLERFNLMRRSLTPVGRKRDNQLVIAFWSCLQLERFVTATYRGRCRTAFAETTLTCWRSDILAELPLAPSGVLSYEQYVPYPNDRLVGELGFEEHVLQSYSGQLFLRNRLNEIHKNFYDAKDTKRVPPPPPGAPEPPPQLPSEPKTISILVESLEDRRWIPTLFDFSDRDPPSEDILAARLRAKYWGARVITFRPFIRKILYVNHSRRSKQSYDPSTLMPGDFRSDIDIPHLHPDAVQSGESDPEVIN